MLKTTESEQEQQINLATLGRELKKLRLKKGLSQDDVAERLGIHRNSVSRYEMGADIPTMIFLRLCVALEGNVAEILERIMK